MDELRIIGGGARSALWRQMVADDLGRPLLVPVLIDASAGAALLAGVGAGIFADPASAAGTHSGVIELIEPTSVARRRIESCTSSTRTHAPRSLR